MIRFGMKLMEMIEQLTKGFIKATGRQPDNLEKLKIQQEAVQRFKDMNKVVDMQGRTLDPSKTIIGGTQEGAALKSGIMKATGAKPKKIQRESLEDFVDDAGGVDPNDPRGIDDFIPDPDKMAQGGRAGYASGGISALKALLNFFAKQRGTKGSQQLKDINPKSVPSGIMNIMGPEHRKMLEKNQTDYLESLLGTIKSDKKFLDKNKEIAKQIQKDIDEAGFGDFTNAEKMLQPFIESAIKGDRLDRMKVYDKINIDDAIMDIEQMIKNRRMRESDGRALNASGGRAGFKDGPDQPGRRKFMKIMGGLATLPILGKFVKPAMPLIKKGAELTGPALDKIIEVVMSAGKLVSQSGRKLKELTTKKKLKDIEVEEDMMDGPSYTIKTKDKTIYYKPGKQDEMGIEDDIIEVIEDTVTKKASGGVARMLGE